MSDKTMQQVYLLAQEHCGLNVGDWVRVTRRAESNEAGWGDIWDSCKSKTVGLIGHILARNSYGIRVYFKSANEEGYQNLPYFILEKVEKSAHEFKPFDRVLVRNGNNYCWRPDFFSSLISGAEFPYNCISGRIAAQCIPYEGNEHLCGTTNKPEE